MGNALADRVVVPLVAVAGVLAMPSSTIQAGHSRSADVQYSRTALSLTAVKAPVRSAHVIELPTLVEPRGAGLVEAPTPQAQIKWIHKEAELTADQIARVAGVTRRSIHLWAAGGRMSSSNMERVARVYAVVRSLDESSPAARRSMLFAHRPGKMSIYDELVSELSTPQVEVGTTPARALGVDRV